MSKDFSLLPKGVPHPAKIVQCNNWTTIAVLPLIQHDLTCFKMSKICPVSHYVPWIMAFTQIGVLVKYFYSKFMPSFACSCMMLYRRLIWKFCLLILFPRHIGRFWTISDHSLFKNKYLGIIVLKSNTHDAFDLSPCGLGLMMNQSINQSVVLLRNEERQVNGVPCVIQYPLMIVACRNLQNPESPSNWAEMGSKD